MKENKTLEYKENITNTFLKTVSAFANFDQLKAGSQELSFSILEEKLQSVLGIDKLEKNIFKTLELYSDAQGYNHAAELLADVNNMPGIDIAKMGESDDEIRERIVLRNISVLKQLDETMKIYRRYYTSEIIDGTVRRTKEMIPSKAFREVIANALVHRTWDVSADIKIAMYDNRIQIQSPGGLPAGIGVDEYMNGQLSILRNPVLGNVFFRLGYIERFGTGIKRIKREYSQFAVQPEFVILDNSIKIVMPVVNAVTGLSTDEAHVLTLFQGGRILASSEVAALSGFTKSKTVRLLKSLVEKHLLKIHGSGRGTRYGVNSNV